MAGSVIELVATAKGDPGAAGYLRELADKVERGDVREVVVIANDEIEQSYHSFGIWEDRWRLLGAIENAKSHVFDQ